MIRFLVSIILFFCTAAAMAQSPTDNMTHIMNGYDDSMYHVQMGHTFPYYGHSFTDAWMSTNGFILLYDPIAGVGNPNQNNSLCCNGESFTHLNNINANVGRFSYMLAPLWTDLIDANRTPDDGFYYQTNDDFTRFLWYNVKEYYNVNANNTFGIELLPTGEFSFFYDDVNLLAGHTTFFGYTGDLVQDRQQSTTLYFSEPSGSTLNDISSFASQTFFDSQGEVDGYNWYSSGTSPGPDCSNPLNDSSCQGYEAAYFIQQCSLDPLYNNQCPGYEVAYFDQQCSLDPLYNNQCPGYEVAYILNNPIIVSSDPEIVTIDSTTIIQVQEVVEDTIEEPAVEIVEKSIAVVEAIAVETVTTSDEVSNVEVSETRSTPNEKVALSPSLLKLALSIANDASGPAPSNNGQQSNSTSTSEESSINQLAESSTSDQSSDNNNSTNSDLLSDSTTSQIISIELANASEVEVISEKSQTDNTQNFLAATDQVDISTIESSLSADQETVEVVVVNSTNQLTTNNLPAATNNSVSFVNNNMQQVLAMGGTITQILNTPSPDFSRFEIKPPTQDEQIQTAKVENVLENMTAEDIENQTELRIGSMDPEAQVIALQLIGYKPGFDQYGGVLADQNNWYLDRGMYTNNRVPSASSSNQLFGAQNQRHQELMSLQYGR